jgi:hypothetical protein
MFMVLDRYPRSEEYCKDLSSEGVLDVHEAFFRTSVPNLVADASNENKFNQEILVRTVCLSLAIIRCG